MNILYTRIRELANDRNLSLAEIERRLKLSNGIISTWKNSKPSQDKIELIADFFNVSVDYLLGRTDNKNLLDDSKKQKPEIQSLARKMDDFSQSDLEAVEDFLDFIMHKNKNKWWYDKQ